MAEKEEGFGVVDVEELDNLGELGFIAAIDQVSAKFEKSWLSPVDIEPDDDHEGNPDEEDDFDDYDDDEPGMISPMLDLNLGKIEIFRDGNLMGFDIKLRPSINDDTLIAYRTVARDSFEYFGEFCGSGWHRFVLRRFADKPITFQLQYLGWMIMEIQVAFLVECQDMIESYIG